MSNLLPAPGVYKITAPDGRVYVGASNNLQKRHNKYVNHKCHKQTRLLESLLTFGFSQHDFQVITYCLEEDLAALERYHGEKFDVLGEKGLNSILPAVGDKPALYRDEVIQKFRDRRHSKETREKMSRKKEGGNHPNSRNVIHTQTKKVFGSVKEAAEFAGVNRYTLARHLRKGTSKEFIYENDDI